MLDGVSCSTKPPKNPTRKKMQAKKTEIDNRKSREVKIEFTFNFLQTKLSRFLAENLTNNETLQVF
jgi:hypothetical protein